MFNSIARNRFDNISLKFLGSEMGKGFRESVVESASEHDNELQQSAGPNDVCTRPRRGHRVTTTVERARQLPSCKDAQRMFQNIQRYQDYPPGHIHGAVRGIVCAAAVTVPLGAVPKA